MPKYKILNVPHLLMNFPTWLVDNKLPTKRAVCPSEKIDRDICSPCVTGIVYKEKQLLIAPIEQPIIAIEPITIIN